MLINGRYRLQNKLGEGGMAEVWLALDESLKRPVALKRLRPEFAHDKTFLKRFEREAQLVAQLNSPHIVQVYDIGISGDARFIAMEYVEGQDLNALLEEEAPLLPERALRLLRDITAGIAEAHEAGLVHRDLKPANVLISKRGEVKVTDFGIARNPNQTALTAPGLVWGTSYYMAPEQVMGKPPTPGMDVYALGVLLFEMLSGELPYPGDDAMAVSMAHIHQPVPSVRALQPSISVELDRLVQRLMAKEPAERPQNGRELLRIIDGFLSGGFQTVVHPVQMPSSEAATRQWSTPSPPNREPINPKASQRTDTAPSSFKLTGAMVAAMIVLCLFIGMGGIFISGIFGNGDQTGSGSSGGAAQLPTFTPTATLIPSLTPTASPSVAVSSTASPTIPPPSVTSTATFSPVVKPSLSATPSEIASATFTALPSETSTVAPSATVVPSATPTIIPSATPTVAPSETATPTVLAYPTPTNSNSIRPAETAVTIGMGRDGNGPDAYALAFTTGARISIDGNLSEWDKSEPVPLTNVVSQPENRKGISDLSGKAYFAWDENALYLAIERVDNEHLQTNSGHELYRDDSVELWLDTNLEADFFEAKANKDDFQFAFSAGDFTSLKAEGVTYWPNRDERQLVVASQPSGTSYTLEARIPWGVMDVTPKDEMVLGYAVVLNDNDSPQSKEPKTQVASNLKGAYLQPHTFGNLILFR